MENLQVTVYATPNCVQCNATKKMFTQLDVPFDVVDLTQHPDKLDEFKTRGYTSAPIVTAGNKIWSGFRIEQIKDLAAVIAVAKKGNNERQN